MSDEDLYLQATDEVDSDNRDIAIWAKAIAIAEGDQEKAKYKYITLRVEQLAKKSERDKDKLISSLPHEFLAEYMHVDDFSRHSGLAPDEIVRQIRNGTYDGQIRNNTWFISKSHTSDMSRKRNDVKLGGPITAGSQNIGRDDKLENNIMATTGFALGIASIFLSFIGIIPLLATLLSIIGLATIKPNRHKNRWMAIVGLALGIVYLIVNLHMYGHI